MFKIKLLILLLNSLIVVACSSKHAFNNNQKFSIAYINGEYDGLLLKNTLMENLKSLNIYENNAVYNIRADINHEEEFYITNIDNTSDRQKIMSSLKIQVIDQINKCTVLNYNKTISQFYIFASSDQFISNKVAEKKIKKNNTEILVKNLIPKLIKTKLNCID